MSELEVGEIFETCRGLNFINYKKSLQTHLKCHTQYLMKENFNFNDVKMFKKFFY